MKEEEKTKPNKDYDGDDCFICEDMVKEGCSQEDIDKEHADCHGWTHCGEDCCGFCLHCGG